MTDIKARDKVSCLSLKNSAEDLLARLDPTVVALDKVVWSYESTAEKLTFGKKIIIPQIIFVCLICDHA